MKRFLISIYLIFQAIYMLFAPTYCTCEESIYDVFWYVLVVGTIGVFCILERDVNRIWSKLFRVTGYISFFFCIMFIVAFDNNLINNYIFNLSIYLIYILSVIYVLAHSLIIHRNDSRK
jgi:hypothetical protein